MKPTKEKLDEYKAIAKKSQTDMELQIRRHLVKFCPTTFREDYFTSCIKYITDCAREILGGKSGDVADEACYKMARDYFNDSLWKLDYKHEKEQAAVKAHNDAIPNHVGKVKKKTSKTQELMDKFSKKYHLNESDAAAAAKNPEVEKELLENSPVNPDDPKDANDQRIATDAYNHEQIKAIKPEPGQLDFFAQLGMA